MDPGACNRQDTGRIAQALGGIGYQTLIKILVHDALMREEGVS